MFCTGVETLPPLGLSEPGVITVLQNSSVLPNTNTCPQELELPGLVNSFEEFRGRLNSVLDNQKTGFGVI